MYKKLSLTLKKTTLPRVFLRSAVLGLAPFVLAAGSSPLLYADAIDDLREEIQTLKEEYESRISDLEQRLLDLQDQSTETRQVAEKASVVASAAEQKAAIAKQKSEDNESSLYNASTPDYPQLQVPGYVTKGFRYHGNLAVGYGTNPEGSDMEEFIIPDGVFSDGDRAGAFQLGNNNESYGELTFVKNWMTDPDEPQVESQVTLAFSYAKDKENYVAGIYDYNGLADAEMKSDLVIREAFVRATNVIGDEDTAVWAGQRFYDRRSLDLYGFYTRDMAGWGGGIENLDVMGSKLSIAYLGGTLDKLVSDDGSLTKQNLDFLLEGYPLMGDFDGKVSMWTTLTYQKGAMFYDPDGTSYRMEAEHGAAVGLAIESEILGATNRAYIQYGFNVASDFSTYVVDWALKNNYDDAYTLRVADEFTIDLSDALSLSGMIMFENADQGFDGISGGSVRNLFSAGLRPVVRTGEHTAIAFEASVDYIDTVRYNPADEGGMLWKLTIAPMIKPSRKDGTFLGDTEISVYATYAGWSQDLRGMIGGSTYDDNHYGFSLGVRASTSF